MEIIGIYIIKNEDIFFKRSLTNVLDFCDRIIILNNSSTDGTSNIIDEFTNNSKIKTYNISDIRYIINHYS